MPDPLVSFVISTHNRKDALRQTLSVLRGIDRAEIFVIDNAGTDGTAEMVGGEFPEVNLLRQRVNRGPCAKNLALPLARGRYVVFLDDDSFPLDDSIERMIAHFEADPRLGAAIFAIHLADGGQECSAYPEVFAGCGVGLRAAALREVGGLPGDFFMQAEEYDLSLRLLGAGWGIRRFEDLRVRHMKTPAARFPSRVMRLDVRNNLTLAGRYFPDRWILPFAADWAVRYRMIAAAHGRLRSYYAGLAAGMFRLFTQRRRPVSTAAFETFAKINCIEGKMAVAAQRLNLKRILLIDLGKNILPYRLAARRCGLKIVAIADERLGGRGFKYHGSPIVTDAQADSLDFDAAIVSNLSPVHARQRAGAWRLRTRRTVIDLMEDESTVRPQGLAA